MYKTHHSQTIFGSWDVEKVEAVVARSTFPTKECVKKWQSRTTFRSWDIKKVDVVVARSTFPSQNVKSAPTSEHFSKLGCRKSARPCGAKHISKSKCTKHTMLGSKKCTPLWREAHFQPKSVKTGQSRTTFRSWDVEKVEAVVARSTFPSQKCKKLWVLSLFWRSDVEKVHTN